MSLMDRIRSLLRRSMSIVRGDDTTSQEPLVVHDLTQCPPSQHISAAEFVAATVLVLPTPASAGVDVGGSPPGV